MRKLRHGEAGLLTHRVEPEAQVASSQKVIWELPCCPCLLVQPLPCGGDCPRGDPSPSLGALAARAWWLWAWLMSSRLKAVGWEGWGTWGEEEGMFGDSCQALWVSDEGDACQCRLRPTHSKHNSHLTSVYEVLLTTYKPHLLGV